MKEKIIEKVRKLVALGTNEGASDGERENAMRMAHAFLAKHNLSMLDLEESSDRTTTQYKVWADAYRVQLAAGCADLFFCYLFKTKNRDPKLNIVTFVGRKDNIITATEMTDYLIKSVNAEAKRLGMGNAFKNGAAAAIRARVREMIAKPNMVETSSCTDLMVIGLHKSELIANQDFVKNQLSLNLVSKKAPKRNLDAEEYAAGKQFGKTVNLNKQIK